MGMWQPAGLTEGQWRDVVAPPPSPAATVPLPMASPQGGFGSRHHDRRETAIDHQRAVERIVRGIMIHPSVGQHIFPRSEEHTFELQSLKRTSEDVFCL